VTHARWKREGYDPELLVRRLQDTRQEDLSGGMPTFTDGLFEDAASSWNRGSSSSPTYRKRISATS
jgi:hypothetical protein